MPAVEQPVVGTISYHIRHGKHDVTDYDWQRYLDCADRNFQASSSSLCRNVTSMRPHRYRWSYARRDLVAGLTVAAIAVPQAMAYALIAGIDPRYGLYSAIVVTAVASIFGSSAHLINGPTNAISLVTFSALAFVAANPADAVEATFLLAVMAGGIQILVAVFRLGDLTRYISASVVIGFMAGAGFLIALTQVGNLLGLKEQGTGQNAHPRAALADAYPGRGRQPAGLGDRPGNGLARGAAAEDHAPLSPAAFRHAPGIGDCGDRGRHAGLVASAGDAGPAVDRGRRRNPVQGFPPCTSPTFRLGLDARDVGQRLGGRLPGPAGSLVDCQGHFAPDPPAAGLQSAMPGRGAGQPLRRVLPMPARFRVVDPLGDQLTRPAR